MDPLQFRARQPLQFRPRGPIDFSRQARSAPPRIEKYSTLVLASTGGGKSQAAARAMYQEDPDGHWALRYVITGPEPPADLVERARKGKLSLPSDRVAFSQRLIWEWIQAEQVRIEVPRRDNIE